MKKKVLISLMLISITLLTIKIIFINNKKESSIVSEASKIDKILEKPAGIQAFTLEGEKTSISFNDLINNYVLDKITCKNGTTAKYNKATNEVSLSNIKMPDYCTMNFKYTIYGKLLADNSTIKTRTDFTTTYTETNTGTLFRSTESIAVSTAETVYYFAGNAQNNWVKFGGFYWRIIRTNADGSVRLLYSGTSPDTTEGYIKTSAFSSLNDDSVYAGYMYGTSGSLESNRLNTNDSTIKGVIDDWYEKNLLSSYNSYISTTAVYCNDREIGNGTYSARRSVFYNAAYTRLVTNKSPTYSCTNQYDAFSASNTNAFLKNPIALMTADEIVYAGGKSGTNNASAWYYLNSANNSVSGTDFWWLLSPSYFSGYNAFPFSVCGSSDPGFLGLNNPTFTYGVRPVISLKGDLTWKSGNGTSSSPYQVEDPGTTLYSKLLADNPTIKTRTDFTTTYTETNTGTLFKSTESIAGSTAETVYYFAGNAQNNWVYFGGFYWRIIRTNHDGSVRMLYAGTSPDTTQGYIGTSAFNTSYNDSMYVGYMYGKTGSLDNNRLNTNNSTIKGVIDNWYKNNLNNYTKYLSKTAVYCNDREASNYSVSNMFYYDVAGRLNNKNITYNCENIKDAFSVSNLSAKLNYPIALMTAEEVAYAGGKEFANLQSPYTWYILNSNGGRISDEWYWYMSPSYYDPNTGAANSRGEERLSTVIVSTIAAIRPVISLSSDVIYSSGDGSASNPYQIIYN